MSSFFYAICLLLLSLNAKAQTRSGTLHEQAQQEVAQNLSPAPAPQHLDQNETQLILQMNDPLEEVKTRTHKWLLGLALTPYQPQGLIQTNSTTQQDLSQTGPLLIPILSAGYLVGQSYQSGFEINLGYSQKQVEIEQAYRSVNARVDVSLTEASWIHRWILTSPGFAPFISLGVGRMNWTQVSESSTARWNEQKDYASLGLGADRRLSEHWHLVGSWKALTDIDKKSNSQIELPHDLLEVGTLVIW